VKVNDLSFANTLSARNVLTWHRMARNNRAHAEPVHGELEIAPEYGGL
jgi:hypothetical protein